MRNTRGWLSYQPRVLFIVFSSAEYKAGVLRVAILQIYEWLRIDVVSNIILLRLRSKIILSIAYSQQMC